LKIYSLIVHIGTKEVVPIGIQEAMMGMKRGERRCVIVPPLVLFEARDWNPHARAKADSNLSAALARTRLGGAQPPFPASTI
jgi:hypothetical protein